MKILTFDIEEWFHILDNSKTKGKKEWLNFESRIHANMDKIFEIIEKTNTSATFLVVGWIAEKYPEIIKKIVNHGFEIGSHTHLHQLVYEQDRKTFKNDVEKSIKFLEDCSGKKVTSFRAPGFSITKKINGHLKFFMSWVLQKIYPFFLLDVPMVAYLVTAILFLRY